MDISPSPTPPLDLDAVRQRLAGATGRTFWRSLEEVADTPEFVALLHREFPERASEWIESMSRRHFVHLMGASLALAGLGGCGRAPVEKIVPYTIQPEEVVPGRALFYATAFPFGRRARGVLVKSVEGRPIKAEGNPLHSAVLGGCDPFAQASLLGLYDPDRSQTVLRQGRTTTLNAFLGFWVEQRLALAPNGGKGLRLLTGPVGSPTLRAQIARLLAAYPQARWHEYDPLGAAGGTAAPETYCDLEKADVIVSLDADFFFERADSPALVRQFARRRDAEGPEAKMNRLYVAESGASVTGAKADRRLRLRPSRLAVVAEALGARLGVGGGGSLSAEEEAWVVAAAADLGAHSHRGAVLAGLAQPPEIHALAERINRRLGNLGRTVFPAPVPAGPPPGTLAALTEAMAAGDVGTLLIHGTNPAYDAPAELGFAGLLPRVPNVVHLGLYADETAAAATWHVPEAHYLESWGDAVAPDGTVSIQQPLILPLYDGISAIEWMALLLGEDRPRGYQVVRDAWAGWAARADFDAFWNQSVHDGVIKGVLAPAGAPAPPSPAPVAAGESGGLEVLFRPDPSTWDGSYANNGWLQELPRPLTKLVWDNAVLLSPATAQRLGVGNGEIVAVTLAGRAVEGPVWIVPGHADECLTLPLGYGRERAGRVGSGIGFNASRVRTAAGWWWAAGAQVGRTGKHHVLVSTQQHHQMEGRDILRTATLAEFAAHPEFAHTTHAPEADETLYPKRDYNGHAWGMAINLSTCIGCNACMSACQAENNIPVVGKEQAAVGRAMHWIRVDRYYEGGLEDPATHFQPVPCMQCENAPCELVCPVAATAHSSEGLNDMTYNRCVGTRFCSNNCPYKVRRFNFLEYNDRKTEVLKLLRNPNVTVRERGVMEKCTYCVQRINEGRIASQLGNRALRDGEIVTACQQACPADAIVFGDLNDPASRVSRLKRRPTNYALLGELNTRPRTTYLAKVTNPGPAQEGNA